LGSESVVVKATRMGEAKEAMRAEWKAQGRAGWSEQKKGLTLGVVRALEWG
jgi:hypothetical protein